MKEILFKNGGKMYVTQEVANIIRDRIIEGAKPFQCFDEGNNTDLTIIINLSEIVYIKDQYLKT